MVSAKRDYHEKRNYIRMKVDTPCSVTISSGNEEYQGVCKDLSGGGMLVELSTAIPIGTEAIIEIASDHGHAPMLKAISKVSRVESQPSTETQPCTLGLEILEVLN